MLFRIYITFTLRFKNRARGIRKRFAHERSQPRYNLDLCIHDVISDKNIAYILRDNVSKALDGYR